MSLATQIITIYCGIFFISGKRDKTSESYNINKDFYLSPEIQFCFFLVIAFFNVMFLVLWVVKFLDI